LQSGDSPKERTPIVATMLFSHTHHDHTQGFPFFAPAHLGSSTLYIFGPRLFQEDLEEALSRAMLPPSHPIELHDLKSLKIIRNIEESEVILLRNESRKPEIKNVHRDEITTDPGVAKISMFKSYAHPKVGALIYKISWHGKSIVYASDTESYIGGDTRLTAFAKGADLLIHDAQYTEEEYVSMPLPKQGWGHSTPEMAAAIAKASEVKRLAFFHHDPSHTDEFITEMEKQAQKLFSQSFAAYEGLTIEL
ncbi:MAG: MBL fold metallo-hydrolase, partial [Anaerolineae bacterium]